MSNEIALTSTSSSTARGGRIGRQTISRGGRIGIVSRGGRIG